MKVSGFTFIKDAVKYDYPIVEAITSVLPICDDFIVAVGKSSDRTLDLIAGIAGNKIRIIETEWDESIRTGGKVLAVETNKAFSSVPDESDWAFYIQGDEVLHEKYLETVYNNMQLHKDDKKVDGLLFNYLHFYGSYDYIGSSPKWYDREIRVIKNDKRIYSYRDAQGFRKNNNVKLNVKPIEAYIYHYGWVKEPKTMQNKQLAFNKYWHDDDWVKENILDCSDFDYSSIDALQLFTSSHPSVMVDRITAKNWRFDHDLSLNKLSLKGKLKIALKRHCGLDLSYKNYRII